MKLMEDFDKENVPFSVAVIDMDWHRVDDVDPKYGSGWTGYSWNKKTLPGSGAFSWKTPCTRHEDNTECPSGRRNSCV